MNDKKINEDITKSKPNFEALKRNIIDVIWEEQIKLGYRREVIRLFYPAKSVNNLLEIEASPEKLMEILKGLNETTKSTLGEIKYSRNEERFCFLIPEEGVEYINAHLEERGFLKEFIDQIREHHCTLEDIKKVFEHHNGNYICEKADHGEFDYLLWFPDGNPDTYLYCIKFEGPHAIYHRFTKKDYEDFQF